MVQLRKNNPVLVYGAYKLLVPNDPQVYAYTRTMGNQKLLVLMNFSKAPAHFVSDKKLDSRLVLINNYQEVQIKENRVELKPYQAVIIQLK